MSDENFVCECPENFRSACNGLEFYREVEGKKYCVLHCPVQDKVGEFNTVFQRKLGSSEYNFRGVYFPVDMRLEEFRFDKSVDFSDATFLSTASFMSAQFSATALFCRTKFCAPVSFSLAKFNKNSYAYFSSATFSDDANFFGAIFGAYTDFNNAKFSKYTEFSMSEFVVNASFINAAFEESRFRETKFFAEANFLEARFESDTRFIGNAECSVFLENASLNLEFAKFIKPDQCLFHTIRLRPNWFVNVDSRKFEFTNIDWVGFDEHQPTWKERATQKLSRAWKAWPAYIKHGICSEALYNELQVLSEKENRHRLLSSAYRQLATNAEDNKRYGEAGRFHYASMDARRLERGRGWNIFSLEWWYWLMSGYGERFIRATSCLFVLLFLFSWLFTRVGLS